MRKIIELRKIGMYGLRNVCVRNNWFTCGDNEQYSDFLNKVSINCENVDYTTELSEELAEIIIANSELDNDHNHDEHLLNIMYCLAQASYATYEIVEE